MGNHKNESLGPSEIDSDEHVWRRSSLTMVQSTADALAGTETASVLQNALEIATTLAHGPPERRNVAERAAAHRLIDIGARDSIETMIAAQMLALHAASIDCASRAMLPEQNSVVRHGELALAARLSRAFAHLAYVLDRRRRGGEQKVRVEHVHVHAGGQAVVGTVELKGGGRQPKTAKQSHAN